MKKLIPIIFILCSFSLFAQEAQPKQSLIQKVETWYENNMNYGTITLLMAVESSFVPLPSEIIIPPAAYIASKPDSKLSIVGVVLFGTLGALIGALFNYFLALSLGRIIVYKFADSKIGHLFLLNGEKVQKAEDYFNENGNTSTFIGRLLPGIRHLISIPAGLARMKLVNFVIFTTLGAFIWNIILALIGYLAQGQQDLLERYSHELTLVLLLLGVAFIAYIVIKTIRKKNNDTKKPARADL